MQVFPPRIPLHDLDTYIPDVYNLNVLYDLYDLYCLAHVSGWKPRYLHGLAHVSWV